MEYYNGSKLLSLKDINGDTPEIYIVTTNRSGGKTTYFGRYYLNRYFKYNEKFMLLYRFNYELDNVGEKFFKDIGSLFFPDKYMTSKSFSKGVYHELYVGDRGSDVLQCCGYAVALNNADQIRKYSHLFSDVQRMMLDEFQPESNRYCNNEIEKFQSMHTSVARGNHKQVRYVPVHLIGNPVTILNPYYVAFGVADRLRENTRFLRGEGFVLEQGYVDSAAKAQSQSAFNRAFKGSNYVNYAMQGVYLNDTKAFIEKPEGRSRYICTIKYNNKYYGMREFNELGIIYCDNRPDMSCPNKLSVTTQDHDINYVMLKSHTMFLSNMRYLFDKGAFRFANMSCKECVLAALSY